MTLYSVRHRTSFFYEREVGFARCNLRLKPIDWSGQTLISNTLSVEPGGILFQVPQRSGLSNITRLVVSGATNQLEIISASEVVVSREPDLPAIDDLDINTVAKLARESNDVSNTGPANFLYPSPFIPPNEAIARWCSDLFSPSRPALQAALDLAVRIFEDFRFDLDATKTETLPETAFLARAGVCQDFAQIMICGLRAAGLPP